MNDLASGLALTLVGFALVLVLAGLVSAVFRSLRRPTPISRTQLNRLVNQDAQRRWLASLQLSKPRTKYFRLSRHHDWE